MYPTLRKKLPENIVLCVIIIHKNGKIRISLMGNTVKAVVFLKNNGA